jgi:hypothetical protein
MEPEGSLPCSKEPSTGPFPQPNQSSPYHPILSPEDKQTKIKLRGLSPQVRTIPTERPYLSKIHFNIRESQEISHKRE